MKQRLIGAAVLVALAVIFLPMLVDGPEPQQGTSSVPLDIPAPPERSFETRELPVAPATPAPDAATPTAAVDPDRIVTVEAENGRPPEAMPEELAPAATPETSTSAPVDSGTTPTSSSATSPASATTAPTAAMPTTAAPNTATAGTAAATITAAPATAAATPATGAVPAATPGGRYVVNLGSYGNVANADALVAAMKRAGLPAYADGATVAGKAGRRVRIGPFAQKGEAEAARLVAARTRADVPATVVSIESDEAAAAPAPARTPVATGYAVQLGALKTEADANALRDKARGAGFTAYVERADTEAGALFRVRVGPELQRANAESLKTQIRQKLALDGVVVTHP